MPVKEFVKSLLPPIVLGAYRTLWGRNSSSLSGNYQRWDEALSASSGYDGEAILEKTKSALVKVKSGQAVYERDSVLFDEVQYTWPLLAGLMWVAAQNRGALNILDFGGSLGSTYFQNFAFLRSLPEVRWNVVEQPGHVAVGKEHFEDDTLKFYATIEACLEETQPNIVLLGGVLQYLEHPYRTLDELSSLRCRHMILDRTPIWDGATDKLCVQKVSPDIYPASYPSWIFSRTRFVSHLGSGWTPLAEYENPDKLSGPVDFSYRGMILVRPTHDREARGMPDAG